VNFLSDDWFDVAHERLNSDTAFLQNAVGLDLRLWIVALKPPDWAHDITVIVSDGRVDLNRGQTGRPDAAGRAPYLAWFKMFRQELSPKRAALKGQLRGSGLKTILNNWKAIDEALGVLRSIPVER
jgi:putative sterol carrier protein